MGPPLEHIQVRDAAAGRVKWTVSVDSTVNRTHQHAAGARKMGTETGTNWKIRDDRGLPLSIVLTPGNTHDATAFGQVLDGIRVPRSATGRPRTTPNRVLGGKAYSSREIGRLLWRRGIATTIPQRRDQIANRKRRGTRGGRPPAFDQVVHRDRNVVERCLARLTQFRAIATRFDKLAVRYRAGIVLASLILWLREPTN